MHADHNDVVRLPVILTATLSLCACLLIALCGGYISTQRGGQMSDGVTTMLATTPGVLIPAGVLLVLGARPAPMWGVPVLAMTVLRAMIVLGAGGVVYSLIGPAKTVFFMTLLASLLTTLGIDVASVLSVIQKHQPATPVAGESKGVC